MHPKLAGFSHVSLSCRDVDASTRFYCETLGFAPLMKVDTLVPGVQELILVHDDSGAVIGLQPTFGRGGTVPQGEVAGMHHLGFRCLLRSQLDDWRAHLLALGAEATAIEDYVDETGGGATLYTTDPDGISIEFFYCPAHPEPVARNP